MDPDVIFWFKILGGMMAAVVLLYFLMLRDTGKLLPEETNLKPLLTVHVTLGRDAAHEGPHDISKEYRFSVYPDFIVIHSEEKGRIHRREDLSFTAKHSLLAKWLHMKDHKTGFDSTVNGHAAAILATLQQAGYTVQNNQSAVIS